MAGRRGEDDQPRSQVTRAIFVIFTIVLAQTPLAPSAVTLKSLRTLRKRGLQAALADRVSTALSIVEIAVSRTAFAEQGFADAFLLAVIAECNLTFFAVTRKGHFLAETHS